MGLSRWFDQHAREALPPGTVVAPAEKRRQLGNCIQCHNSIATHGYELMAQTCDSEDPSTREVDYHSVVLCEGCYHRLSEKSFWIKTVEELALLAVVIGLVMAILGFAVSRRVEVGIAGVAILALAPLIRFAVRRVRQGMLERTAARFFPKIDEAKFAAMRMPWLEKSILFVVPVPLAVVTHALMPVSDLSMADLRSILSGRLTNWKQLGGPDLAIRLYLAVGPWREWSLIQQELLGGEKAAAHVALAEPLELFSRLADDPGGLGFISTALLERFGHTAKAISVDGQKCWEGNGDYPLWLMPGLVPAAE